MVIGALSGQLKEKDAKIWSAMLSNSHKICPANDLSASNYLWNPGVSKDKNKWFWGSGTRPEIPKSYKWWGVEGSPITKSNSYKFKLKQNNITELLSTSFP